MAADLRFKVPNTQLEGSCCTDCSTCVGGAAPLFENACCDAPQQLLCKVHCIVAFLAGI